MEEHQETFSTGCAFHFFFFSFCFPSPPQKFHFPHSMLLTLLGSLGLIFFLFVFLGCFKAVFGEFTNTGDPVCVFFSSPQIRLLAKACHRPCLATSVRLLCPPPKGPPMCLSRAHPRQPQPRAPLLRARWETENRSYVQRAGAPCFVSVLFTSPGSFVPLLFLQVESAISKQVV